jgi:predicted nucleic acid-binding protein
MEKILLDTNILIYATCKDSQWYAQAKKLIDTHIDNAETLYIAQNSLYEYAHVLKKAYKLSASEIEKRFVFFLDHPYFEILSPSFYTPVLSQEIMNKEDKKIHMFDVLILAQAIENEIAIIYTKNIKDFPKGHGVRIQDPFTA